MAWSLAITVVDIIGVEVDGGLRDVVYQWRYGTGRNRVARWLIIGIVVALAQSSLF